VCMAGACACPTNTSPCGMPPVCTNVTNNPANCGGCGMTCGHGEVCMNSMCGCPGGFEMCGTADAGRGACTNVKVDKTNCGACGNVCDSGMCANGKCR
jgi:hypothetical protein